MADLNTSAAMKAVPGTGVAVDVLNPKDNKHLITKQEFGDLELELDFMMAKGSNSGVFLQGRYEVQLLDSWTKIHPGFSDCGGIYQRWDDARGEGHQGYEGIAPFTNVSRAPGLWQHLKIRFQAPVFNATGEKISNARFLEVDLNGVPVQLQEEVTGPTRSAAFDDEKTTTGHRYSMNDDTKSRRQGTYGHSNLPLYFSKAVNDAGRCTRVIPG